MPVHPQQTVVYGKVPHGACADHVEVSMAHRKNLNKKTRPSVSTERRGIKRRVQRCYDISLVEKCLISCSNALLTPRHTSTALWTSLILSTRLTAF